MTSYSEYYKYRHSSSFSQQKPEPPDPRTVPLKISKPLILESNLVNIHDVPYISIQAPVPMSAHLMEPL